MQDIRFQKTFFRRVVALFCILTIFFCTIQWKSYASTEVNESGSVGTSSVEPESATWPVTYTKTDGTTEKPYRESDLTYKGKSAYWFVTQDAAHSGQDVYVIFDGESGMVSLTTPLEGVENDDWFTIPKANVVYTSDGNLASTPFTKANATVFVDDGTYFNTTTSYTEYYAVNQAIVGLNNNAVILKRQPLLIGNTATAHTTETPYHFRNIINDGQMLLNLVFDADNIGMVQDRPNRSYSVNGGTTWTNASGGYSWSGNRGATFFYMSTDTSSVLFRNVTIKNIGSGMNVQVSNSAINILADSRGQFNFENLTIENCRGASTDSYRLINVGCSPNVNFKDISFIQGSEGLLRDLIWVENPNSATITDSNTIPQADIRFAGELKITGYSGKDRIGVQQTSYANITAPSGWRYAVYTRRAISTTLGGTTAADIFIYKNLEDVIQTAGSSATSQAVFDLVDNVWLVRSDIPATINDQLVTINTVMQRMEVPFNASQQYGRSNGRGLVTAANIKISANGDGVIPSFIVPAFLTSADDEYGNVHIRAVTESTDLFTDVLGGDNYVPFIQNGTIVLTSTSDKNENVRLYNFDFHEKAAYTLHAAIDGIDTDTDVPGVEIAPKITNASLDTFVVDRFTVLNQDLTLSVPLDTEDTTDDDDTDNYVVGIKQAPFTPTTEAVQAYTYNQSGYEDVTPSTDFIVDDPSVVWVSSDTTVATVDSDTGFVTIAGVGSTTITATAKDKFNGGEIPKPFVYFTLEVQDFKVTFQPGEHGTWTVGSDEPYYIDGLIDGDTFPVPGITPNDSSQWLFEGFVYDENGNGIIDSGETTFYADTDKIYSADRQYIALWIFEPSSTPEPSLTPEPSNIPDTGDSNSIPLMAATLIVSFSALILMVTIRKRKLER